VDVVDDAQAFVTKAFDSAVEAVVKQTRHYRVLFRKEEGGKVEVLEFEGSNASDCFAKMKEAGIDDVNHAWARGYINSESRPVVCGNDGGLKTELTKRLQIR
jgi:hypothetical protein